jgi:hypothetical protein
VTGVRDQDARRATQIVGEVDRGHAAAPERATERVAVADSVGERCTDTGHGPSLEEYLDLHAALTVALAGNGSLIECACPH